MRVTLDTTEVFSRDCIFRSCKGKPTYRHHKGCDNFIGRYHPETRANYHLFLDCCSVCDYHHMVIHIMYLPIIHAWVDYTPRGALRLRAKLITYCDNLINGKVKLVKPTKAQKAEWKRRRRRWLKMKSRGK